MHKARQIIRHDGCPSVANLIQIPSPGRTETVLISPRHFTLDARDNHVIANPMGYIIDGERGVCRLRTEALCSKSCLQQIDLAVLQEALADRASFTPIDAPDRGALRAGESLHVNLHTRLALWHREIRRQHVNADCSADLRTVAKSAGYFLEVTWMLVEPLIEELRQVERQLIMNFLCHMLESRTGLDHQWEVPRQLALFTPETAPTRFTNWSVYGN